VQTNNLPMSHAGHTGSSGSHDPAVHLHGAVVAPDSDGHPKDGIPTGASRTYDYPNAQRACALWYHDHTHEATGKNVYNGLAGMYFVDDPREKILRLPKGAYEVPLVIQDRIFTAGGKMMYILDEATLEDGMHGDVMMVNGIVQPFFKVGTAKYRFRILNGSNARIYKLALSNGASLIQIGTDGGLLQRPKSLASIEIAPSERIDVIIDFSGVPLGTQIVLQNLNGSGRTGSLMRFDVDKKVKDKSRIPEFLVPWEELPEAESVITREFNLNRQSVNGVLTWVINGQAYNEANPPLARPKFNTIEKWRFVNPTIHPHPMHLHLVQFQVIDIDGEPQDPSDHGWKDTVVVPPGSELTILVKFTDYTGRYVFHCHNLEHEDFAMMAEFEVVP
jgi:spore coat protein A